MYEGIFIGIMSKIQAARRLVFITLIIWFLLHVIKLVTESDTNNTHTTQLIPYVVPEFKGPEPRLNKIMSNKPISLFCLILTTTSTGFKAKAVNDTWAKRCSKTVYFTDGHETSQDVVNLRYVRKGREHLTEKVIKAFEYVQTNYPRYDWFLKADDDTYVIIENLNVLLSYFNSKDPVYLGQNFKYFTRQGYNSGGAGYVLSKEALDRLMFGVKYGICSSDGNDEDVDVGKCLEINGVVAYDTTDKLHRETFHAGTMEEHIVGPKSPLLIQYPSFQAQIGPECCSSLTISFHHLTPSHMYIADMLLYHVTVYGRHVNESFIGFE